MQRAQRPKFIASLVFRGFALDPSEVASLVGVKAAEVGKKGSFRRPGSRPLKRSFASWEVTFPDSTLLSEMIPALISHVGGAERIAEVRKQVEPEFLEVDLALWVKDSEEQEGGFIDVASLQSLVGIGATLSIGIYSRDDA